MQVGAIADHGLIETLDAVDRFHMVRVDAEASMFELAAHFVDLRSAETLPVTSAPSPGGERAVRAGGAGTPEVTEFAAAELGCRMRIGTWAARRYVADAVDVRHRLPRIWSRVVARDARVTHARLVAAKTRHLSLEAAAFVDAAMTAHVDGSLPWGRFESRLDGKIVAADPATAAAREEERMLQQFAKRTRSSEDGTAGFYVRSTIGVIARLDATINYIADALKAFADPTHRDAADDADDRDLRRLQAVVVLCNPSKAVELLAAFTALQARTLDIELPLDPPDTAEPTQTHPAPEPVDALDRMDAFARKVGFTPAHLPAWLTHRVTRAGQDRPGFTFDWSTLLPPVTLNVHLAAEDLQAGAGGVARWEGEGPVTHQFVHDHLRPLHSYRIQPVIDPTGLAPVDAYEIPDRHRQAVHLRTPADCFPYSSNLSTRVDIDHTSEYQPAVRATAQASARGAAERHWLSRMDNYGPLGRFHHRIKTHGAWTLRQPFAGIYLWRDPHGQIYLVDHTGTHKLTAPGAVAGTATRYDPTTHLVHTDTIIDLVLDDNG